MQTFVSHYGMRLGLNWPKLSKEKLYTRILWKAKSQLSVHYHKTDLNQKTPWKVYMPTVTALSHFYKLQEDSFGWWQTENDRGHLTAISWAQQKFEVSKALSCINTYRAAKGGLALPFICCVQDIVGLSPPLPLRLLGYGKAIPFNYLWPNHDKTWIRDYSCYSCSAGW